MARGRSYQGAQVAGRRGRRRLPLSSATISSGSVSLDECKRQLSGLGWPFNYVFDQLAYRGAEKETWAALQSALAQARVEARESSPRSEKEISVDTALAVARFAVEDGTPWKNEVYRWLSEAKLKERRPRRLPPREAKRAMKASRGESARIPGRMPASAAASAAAEAVEGVWTEKESCHVSGVLSDAVCAFLWADETEGAIELLVSVYARLKILSWEQSRTGRLPLLR